MTSSPVAHVAANAADLEAELRRIGFETAADRRTLVANHVLYDLEYRGVFLFFVPIRAHDIYRIRLTLDESSRTVHMQDERDQFLKSWTRLRKEVWRGRYAAFHVEVDKLWGRRGDGSLGKLYDYRFEPEVLKAPVRKLVESRGWTVA